MIGETYWSTGISVCYHGEGRWGASVNFYDDGFCEAATTEGVLRTRHSGPLSQVVDLVKADAERLGIRWATLLGAVPTVHCELWQRQDFPPPPSQDFPPPPNWRALVNAEAERLGWVPGYDAVPDAVPEGEP